MKTLRVLTAALAAVLSVFACAKKMLPPSPDRFAPGLQEVNARSRVQLELQFDEPIDAARLYVDSFSLRQADSALLIRGIARGRDASRVLVWTEPLLPGAYSIAGVVWDASGNRRTFGVRYGGSGKADTIPPRVKRVDPAPGTANLRGIPMVSVSFSEPIDTTVQAVAVFAPAALDSSFAGSWSPDWQELRVVYTDSGKPLGPVYAALLPGARDLEGNRCADAAFTYFTADSILEATSIRGRVVSNGPFAGTGIVCFDRDRTEALVPVGSDGTFGLALAPGSYLVRAAADTNRDGLTDLAGQVDSFITASESLSIFLNPDTAPRTLGAYRR